MSIWNWILWNIANFQLIELLQNQTILIFIFSIHCLIELKFCKASRNYFSNRCWKFQFSILKKSFISKKYSLGCYQYQNKNALFINPIFSEGFEYCLIKFQKPEKERENIECREFLGGPADGNTLHYSSSSSLGQI